MHSCVVVRRILPVLLLVAVIIPLLCPISYAAGPPSTAAESAILTDISGKVLYESNADERLPMASTTKIMTGLLAIEYLALDDVITVPECAVGVEGTSAYLTEGEELTVEGALFALLLGSANDAAVTLAVAVSGSVIGFAALMNVRAAGMGLENTHFTNPHGLDDEEHYTTARELATIAAVAMKNDTFSRIVSTKCANVAKIGADGVRVFVNHNRLLFSYSGAKGVKTGYTSRSGRCLVSCAERDGLKLICVTINDRSDWRDHTALFDYGFANYAAVVFATENLFSTDIPVRKGESEFVSASNPESLILTLPRSCSTEYVISVPEYVEAPVKEGEDIGCVEFFADGESVGSVRLVCRESVKIKKSGFADFFRRLFRYLGELFF